MAHFGRNRQKAIPFPTPVILRRGSGMVKEKPVFVTATQ
jgi:hypothetical protein